MARRKRVNWLAALLLALAAGWTAYQIFAWSGGRPEPRDSGFLLYQVASFQMELLGSLAAEAAGATDTGSLSSLKLAAYSADYTHERLVLALGAGRLDRLESPAELLRFITRLQIAGSRPLKPRETQILKNLGEGLKGVYEPYAKLLASDGKTVLSSQRDKMKKADRALAVELRNMQLE